MAILEEFTRCYYTTARVIHKEGETDWLWVNSQIGYQFKTPESAETMADLANHNGKENGLDIKNYPYFVVKVTQVSEIERV